MKKLIEELFNKQNLSNSELSNIFGGYDDDGRTFTHCTSATCDDATGQSDTHHTITDDDGKETSNYTTTP